MRVITEPTVIPEGEDCDAIINAIFDAFDGTEADAVSALQKVLQEAFDAGIAHASKAPKAAPTAQAKGSGKVPAYRTEWLEIDEDAPQNPIENFIYRDMPNDIDGFNPDVFLTRLHAALEYVAKHN